MKARTLALLAGVGGSLMLPAPCRAGFVGIKVDTKLNPYGVNCNVYAIFDRPGEDRVEAIAGTPNIPLRIEVLGGGSFYNTPNVGSDQAPSSFLISIFPSLAYDTFVTIGVKAVGTGPGAQPKDNLTITPGFPAGLTGSVIETTEAGYGVTPLEAQGDPFNAFASYPGNGQILIGQFTAVGGYAILGSFLFQCTSNGQQFQQFQVSFYHDYGRPPAPGAVALLALAGLRGRRRRTAGAPSC